MAIAALVLWLLTAGAGFYLLVTSNLGRARPAAASPAAAPASEPAAEPVTASIATPAAQAAPASSATQAAAVSPASKREMRRAARDRFDPLSLTAAKNAPVLPGLRSLLEFAHPASAIVGLGFWLGFTLVHNRVFGWIAFGLVTVTVCLGLTWYTANARAARGEGAPADEPAPSFSTRLVIVHGSAAAVTFVLAGLAALVLSR
jgi:hypothetical protein